MQNEEAKQKMAEIEELKKTILASDDTHAAFEQQLKDYTQKKEELSASHKGFFRKREEISNQISELDKEVFRLNSQREKLNDAREYQTNYMWQEYELTLHAAMDLRDDTYDDLSTLKKMMHRLGMRSESSVTSMSMRSRIIRRSQSVINF